MRKLLLLALASLAACFGQVSVVMQFPINTDTIGQQYQAQGTMSSSAANITGVSLSFDGGGYGPSLALFGAPPTVWLGAIDATALSVGSHTVTARATDALGNIGFSSTINITVVHSTPTCSHTTVGTGIICEQSFTKTRTSVSPGSSAAVTNASGWTAGQLLVCEAEASVTAGARTQLASGTSAGATTFTVYSSTGFSIGDAVTLSPVNGLGTATPQIPNPEDTVTITNIVGTTFTTSPVTHAHAGGEVIGKWGLHPWLSSYLTNTLGYTWSFWGNINTRATDNDIEQMGVYYTFVPSNTLSSDTITVAHPAGDGNIVQVNCLQYTVPAGTSLAGSASLMGWSGPTDGSTPTGGPAYVNPFAVTPGDLIISIVFSAPVVPTAPFNLRVQDASRPFAMISDNIASGSTSSPQYSTNIDGFFLVALDFHPGGASTAGKSIVLSSQTVTNNSIPGCASNATCTWEWSLHGWGTPSIFEHPIQPFAADLNVYWIATSPPVLLVTSLHETGGTDCQIPFTGKNLISIRRQRIASTSSTGTVICQATDETGLTFFNQTSTYTGISSVVTNNGMTLGGTTAGVATAYTRISTNSFSVTATPPTTAQDQTGMTFQWKFDLGNNTGSLIDSVSSPANDGALSSGSPTYIDTPYQNLVVAIATTVPHPSWGTWYSMRVGGTNVLDCSTSYSQANGSPAVACTWNNVSGPATPTIVSPTSQTTNVTGVGAFGTYTFNLSVIDSSANTASINLAVGAVAYDNNGVVIQSNPKVTQVYGPMIAFGQNPWDYATERGMKALALQIANNPYPTSVAEWTTSAGGTISYPFAGVGPSPGTGCYGSGIQGGTSATLAGNITATTLSIPILHAECLSGLSTLPITDTWIYIGNTGDHIEVVRVKSTSATSGPATLTVDYDGRGLAGAIFLNAQPVLPAQAWGSGTIIGEMKIAGTGTHFITDGLRPLCPAGAPGPPGAVTYSTGTVSGSPGGTTLNGIGTSWTQNIYSGSCPSNPVLVSIGLFNTDCAHNMQVQNYIRVNATHGGGTPFVFWAFITAVAAGNGSITISRPLPSDLDGGGFTYKITAPMYWSTEWSTGGNTYRGLQQALGCESETAAFATFSHDITSLDITIQSGLHISYKSNLNAQSAFGPNFYGTGFANRALGYASGYQPAFDFANSIDEYWVKDPELCGGCGGIPLLQGGGVLGGIADWALNGSTALTALDITPFAASGVSDATRSCNYDDPRDQGYVQAWLAMIALFDTDPTRSTAWATGLLNWVTRDQNCRRKSTDGYGTAGAVQENSWAGSSLWTPSGPALTLINGSKAVTGSGFSPGMCAGQDDGTGTITVIGGLTTATVASGSLLSGVRLFINDTSGTPIAYTFGYRVSGTAVTLAWPYPGSGTHTYTFMSENNNLGGYITSIGASNLDYPDTTVAQGQGNNAMLQKVWACKYNGPTSLTLNRAWDGPSSPPNYFAFSYVVSGFQVQEFMKGVKAYAMNLASQHTNPSISVPYKTLSAQNGQWMATYGVDTNTTGTLGTYYDRVHGNCEPAGAPNSGSLFDGTHENATSASPGCGIMGLNASLGGGVGEFTARVNTAEGYHALAAYFIAQCTISTAACNAARTFVDQYYGAIYGNCSMTSGGGTTFYCDSHYVNTANELSDASIGGYKWDGFFFGMGMAHQWPALRTQGSSAPSSTGPRISYTGRVNTVGGIK